MVILLYSIHLNLESAIGAVLSSILDVWYSCFVYGFQMDMNIRSTCHRNLLTIMTIEMRLLLEPNTNWESKPILVFLLDCGPIFEGFLKSVASIFSSWAFWDIFLTRVCQQYFVAIFSSIIWCYSSSEWFTPSVTMWSCIWELSNRCL